jgi:hypothetical protein
MRRIENCVIGRRIPRFPPFHFFSRTRACQKMSHLVGGSERRGKFDADLFVACCGGVSPDKARTLIENAAKKRSLNTLSPNDGISCLFAAVRSNSGEMVRQLLVAGADPNLTMHPLG